MRLALTNLVRGRWRRPLSSSLVVLVIAAVVTALLPGTAYAAERWIPPQSVKGSILAEYERLEGIGKSPGTPTSPERDDRQGGKFQDYVNNNHIYWNARVDPNRGRQVGGAIYNRWGQYDWENGALGYPIQSEMDATGGGKLSRFERGLIYWSSATGAHPVWGEILQTWAAHGYEQSSYGFPTSGEEVIGDGRRQYFQTSRTATSNGIPKASRRTGKGTPAKTRILPTILISSTRTAERTARTTQPLR
ncbi:hypothetical protein ERC79_13190 [Rhodococcus sp. ABRD24]|nr:hypothetical protein ERC79_13190 [Rhodococcus sp. ABRD24]